MQLQTHILTVCIEASSVLPAPFFPCTKDVLQLLSVHRHLEQAGTVLYAPWGAPVPCACKHMPLTFDWQLDAGAGIVYWFSHSMGKQIR